MNRLKIAVYGCALAAAALCLNGTVRAADAPTVSRFLAKPLKAAQDDMKAGKFDEEIARLKEAQAAKGEKTAYDNFLISAMLGSAYASTRDYQNAAPMLQAAALSQYASPQQQHVWLHAVVGIYYQEHNYPKTIEVGQQIIAHGSTEPDVYATIALAQNALGKYKDAAETIQQLIDREPKPEEKYLDFQWDAYNHAGDHAGAAKVIEKLVTYYPKPDYWLNALSPLVRMNINDARLQLDVYRLENDVGVLKQPRDYGEMAELALDAGYPGETVAILQKAFAQNVFTDPRDVMRYQHLLAGAMQRASADQASLPAQVTKAQGAATGEQLVQVGAAYLSYGQPDMAADLIQGGIQKGGLKSPEQANLLLGIAQLRSHKTAAAQRSFQQVTTSSNSGYAELGRLWVLHAQAKS